MESMINEVMNNESLIFKGALVVLMSAFVPASALTFLHVRLARKDHQFQNLVKILGLDADQASLLSPGVHDEYSGRDYLLPTIFLSVLCLAGFSAFLFDIEILAKNAGKRELFLVGLQPSDISNASIDILREQSFLAITMGFIGAFVWSGQNIIRRLIAGDLMPSTYYSASIRIIYSVLIALVLVFLFRVDPGNNTTQSLIPVFAFLTGLMPEQVLNYIRERVRALMQKGSNSADELVLDQIEGMNLFHKTRLSEVSIDNAQNLAEANLFELLLKTPFNSTQLIDWIAQAKLYVYLKSDIVKLREVGIRNGFDMLLSCAGPEQVKKIAEKTGINTLRLEIVGARLKDDSGLQRLYDFHKRIAGMSGETLPSSDDDLPILLKSLPETTMRVGPRAVD